jgi:outer membrane protein
VRRIYFFFLLILFPFWTSSLKAQEVQTLSLDETVLQAIENNLGLKVERYNPVITSQDILIEKGAFDPSLSLETGESYKKALSPSLLESSEQRSLDIDLSLSGKIETGTEYKLAWNYQRFRGDSDFLRLNPYHLTDLTLTVSQPVLKGFGKEMQTSKIRVARENLRLSEYEFRNKAEELTGYTVKTFFDLLFAQEGLDIARFSLSLAEKILFEVQAKVKAGFMAEVDIYNAEAEVAKREETLLKAENTSKDALDSLRRLLGLQDWDKEIILTKPDIPSNELIDLADSLRNAQLYRNDLKQVLIEREKKKILTLFYKNQRLPDLNLFATGGLSGLSDSTSDAFDRLDKGSDKNWKVGFLFRIPLFQRDSKGRYLKAKYEEAQAEETVKALNQRITLEVRQAWRALSLSLKTIEASKKTRIASEKKLKAEERRFHVGLATLTDVLKFQEEYVNSLLNEKKAEFVYHISIAEHEKMKGTLLIKFGISDSELGMTETTS